MRPVKQFGVVSTHSLQNFAPAAASPEAIYVVDDLPRAATGKIQRFRPRQPAWS